MSCAKPATAGGAPRQLTPFPWQPEALSHSKQGIKAALLTSSSALLQKSKFGGSDPGLDALSGYFWRKFLSLFKLSNMDVLDVSELS